jgi:hypothetical protein
MTTREEFRAASSRYDTMYLRASFITKGCMMFSVIGGIAVARFAWPALGAAAFFALLLVPVPASYILLSRFAGRIGYRCPACHRLFGYGTGDVAARSGACPHCHATLFAVED